MRRKDLQAIKIKRILFYYRELERHKVNHEGSIDLIMYFFSVSARWIEELLRTYEYDDFVAVALEYQKIDIIVIDIYVTTLHKKAKKQRSSQLNLF